LFKRLDAVMVLAARFTGSLVAAGGPGGDEDEQA